MGTNLSIGILDWKFGKQDTLRIPFTSKEDSGCCIPTEGYRGGSEFRLSGVALTQAGTRTAKGDRPRTEPASFSEDLSELRSLD